MLINPYINLERVEFVVTDACSSNCRHCSLGERLKAQSQPLDSSLAVAALQELSQLFFIQSVMTFGGEPLLYADTTCAIHGAATACGIPSRQIITNGFFAKDPSVIVQTAKKLKAAGVNSLMLSVDAFHDEYLPFPAVYTFAKAAKAAGIPGLRLHPAWVVNRAHQNPYNAETERCIARFDDLSLKVTGGNDIFPAGNAVKYLREYYPKAPLDLNFRCGQAPYTQQLDNVRCISLEPDGGVCICGFTIGNLHEDSILDILGRYNPESDPYICALHQGGIRALVGLAQQEGIKVDLTKADSPCGLCHEIMGKRPERR